LYIPVSDPQFVLGTTKFGPDAADLLVRAYSEPPQEKVTELREVLDCEQ
jgi:hypothetical protein